jgi:pSer/pThr/pTyr-binding forkhead associated (FHA) protein
MQVKLIVIAGASKSGEITVKPPMTLGRSRDADLTLRHALISRKHCEITEANGKILVRDLGSLNGTFIGGQRINEAPLNNGDELTVGSVTFRVQMVAAAAPASVNIPQGIDPETGLQFLEPADAVETVPFEEIGTPTEQQAASQSSPSKLRSAGQKGAPPTQPAPAQPAAAKPATLDDLNFDLIEDTTSGPDTDDSALGSFLRKL